MIYKIPPNVEMPRLWGISPKRPLKINLVAIDLRARHVVVTRIPMSNYALAEHGIWLPPSQFAAARAVFGGA
jgi:hypothetical protein